MESYSIFFPGYTAGEDAYREIEAVCSPYGKDQRVFIGSNAGELHKNYRFYLV